VPEPEGSEYVRWVQNTLNQVMSLRLPVDGIMGPETRSAIRSFQQRQGLPVDGIVGPETERALGAAIDGQSPDAQTEFEAFDTELADQEWQSEVNRSSSDYIKWVQQSLNQIMGLRLAVDGISGTQTRSAIRSFQQQRGLAVDGIVGPQTEAALIKAGAKPFPTTNYPIDTPLPTYPGQPQPAPNRPGTSLKALQQELDNDVARGQLSRTQADQMLYQARARIYLPFDAQRIRTTSPWGWRRHPVTGMPSLHAGTDFGVHSGTPVPAVKAGTVARSYTSKSAGETVILYHGQDASGYQYYTLYFHNSRRLVSDGQSVSQGQIISYSGNTGKYTTGPHLHYEVRVIPPSIGPSDKAFFKSQYSVDAQDHLWPDLQ